MSKTNHKPISSAAAGNYAALLADIKQRIRTAQVRTAMAGNANMLMLYWEIGGVLAERQKIAGWGAAVLPRLATDLHNDMPEVKGFSARNLRLMIQFFDEYAAFGPIWQRSVARLEDDATGGKKGPVPVAQLPAKSDDAQIWQRAVAKLGRSWSIRQKTGSSGEDCERKNPSRQASRCANRLRAGARQMCPSLHFSAASPTRRRSPNRAGASWRCRPSPSAPARCEYAA